LKKEKITIELTKDEFNTTFDKVINLKDKIEKEIENLNKKFDKTMKDIQNYFILKHEELIKEESVLTEKLKNEVTKTKEKIETFLSELNEQIKLSNRIIKISNKLDKKEKNYLKNISYISKMKELIKNMNKIIIKPLKNIKFRFEEEKRDVNYEEYSMNEEIFENNINIDSIILNESNRKKEFINLLKEWTGFKNMELLYRGNRDGMTSNAFHEKCDNQGKTITLYKNDKGHIFGGYASIPWSKGGNWKSAPGSFIFTLTNAYDFKPTKLPPKIVNKKNGEVYHKNNYGPTFGNDLGLFSNFKEKGWAFKFETFQDILGKTNSLFTGNKNNEDNDALIIKELEVFRLE